MREVPPTTIAVSSRVLEWCGGASNAELQAFLNNGPPFLHPDGSVWDHDQVHVAAAILLGLRSLKVVIGET